MKALICGLFTLLLFAGCGNKEEQLIKKANKIHTSVLTVDTHCDTPIDFVRSHFDLGIKHEDGCVDFPRMKEGGLNVEFFAVFTGQGPRNDSSFNKVHQKALEIFDAIQKNVEKNSTLAEMAYTADDAYR